MSLILPKLIVLDSATLAKVSRDYWSRDKADRDNARAFIDRLLEQSVYITFTLTHLMELSQHGDDGVVRDRIRFLLRLPLVAWLRPYDNSWFPGSVLHLLQRELHAVVHDGKRDWQAIVECVRSDVWETGTGAEIFEGDDRLWLVLRDMARHNQRHAQYVASVLRAQPGNVNNLTVAEIKQLSKLSRAERDACMRRFAVTMKTQLQRHGDQRLENPEDVAASFAIDTLRDVQTIEDAGGDFLQKMLEFQGVPEDLVSDGMTVEDIGRLAVYTTQLSSFSKGLYPRAAVTVHDVPPETLPSYVLEHRLARIQRRAERVSGSDFGDVHIAPLTLYADGVEVDKRTHEYLTQLKRACPEMAGLIRPFFRSKDYADIPDHSGVAA